MNQKEKFEACMAQAKFAYGLHNDRRQSEWKITLGLWAIILTALVHKEILIPGYLWLAIPVLYGAFWLSPIWLANHNNKIWYKHYTTEAARALESEDHIILPPPPLLSGWRSRFYFLRDWSMIFQLAVTVFLVAVAVLFRGPR
jgi:hypothetical protein